MTDRLKQPKVLVGMGVMLVLLIVAFGSCMLASGGDDEVTDPDTSSETGSSESSETE